MISKNIISIIIILFIIGVVVYFYYNYIKPNESTFYSNGKNLSLTDSATTTKKMNPKQNKKHVKFNNEITYNIYTNPTVSCTSIDFDDMSYESDSNDIINFNATKNINNANDKEQIDNTENFDNQFIGEIDLDDELLSSNMEISPSNLDQTDPKEIWDSSFGLPLMSKEEKKDFFDKMQKNHKKYENALSNFSQYQTDQDTIIKTETTINPFKPDHRSESLKGRAIKDIYDQQVAGPKAKPKQIKNRTSNEVTYEDETIMNGGSIPGTNNLYGFENKDPYKTAAFGNEF